MENNFKRFLSLLLAFVMVFGMMPANVFAVESGADESVVPNADPEAIYVAQIGDQGYETLAAAIAAASAGRGSVYRRKTLSGYRKSGRKSNH